MDAMTKVVNKWDTRLMESAKLVASWSKDPDHKVGAVIAKENRILSTGFNGPPTKVIDSNLLREAEVRRTLHAEINAIIIAARPLKEATIYVYPFLPCAQCAAAIIQSGITRVIYCSDAHLPSWDESQKEALSMLKESNIDVFKMPDF